LLDFVEYVQGVANFINNYLLIYRKLLRRMIKEDG